MNKNPLRELGNLGQSVWMDFIRRGMIVSGELKRMIDEDGLRGVTSNPAIFDKAIAGSDDYDERIASLAGQGQSARRHLSRPDRAGRADGRRRLPPAV